MIRRIELINFMSHDRTVIEPADGLTVLVGPNNCGKSAIVNALMILCQNTNSTYVTRHNEKSCSVSVTTEEGDVIEWRRTNDSPKYTINGKLFDRLVRGELPDELHQVLRLPRVGGESGKQFDIHFGEQKSPVFLLNEPGTRAAQFFAASSDAAKLVEIQRRHKQSGVDAQTESKQLAIRSAVLRDELATLNATDSLQAKVADLEQQAKAIDEGKAAMFRLGQGIGQLENALSVLEQRVRATAACSLLTAPPTFMDLKELTAGMAALVSLRALVAAHMARTDALAPLTVPPIMDDERRLSSAISAAQASRDRQRICAAQCDALASLMPPPELPEISQLAEAAVDLASLRARRHALEGMAAVLAALSPVPPLSDTSELERSLGELRTANAALGVITLKQTEVARDLREVENEFHQCVDGCTCPTCGAPMDAERLIARSATGNGVARDEQ